MKKVFSTVLIMFLVVVISTFPTITKKNVIRTNFEIEKQALPGATLYLLNQDDYLVEVEVILPENDKIQSIFDYLKIENKVNQKWKGYIPKEVKIEDYQLKNGLLEIHFSEEAKEIKKEYLSGIVESYLKQEGIEKVEIFIKEEKMQTIPSINLMRENPNRVNLEKMVLFYVEDITNNHLVPVTKYIETNQDKIEKILEELKANPPSHLISYVNENLKLKDYQIENDILILDFNHNLIEDPEKKEWLLEEIAYSMMKNLEVNAVLFQVEGKQEALILNK